MTIFSSLFAALALVGLASCTPGVGPLVPQVDVEQAERQAPVTPTPNPTGQIFDQTLNTFGRGAGLGRGGVGLGAGGVGLGAGGIGRTF